MDFLSLFQLIIVYLPLSSDLPTPMFLFLLLLDRDGKLSQETMFSIASKGNSRNDRVDMRNVADR